MSATIIFLVVILILLMIDPIWRFILCIRELIVNLCSTATVNLREKYGDWAVITGCTDGMGKEYAKELAKNDMNIVLISRNLQKLNATKTELHAINPNIEIRIIQADFSKRDDDFSHVETQLKEIPVGILVNNVGKITEYPMYFEEIPKKDLLEMINLNITATTLMTQMVIGQMKERGKGAIVNLSSIADMEGYPLMSVYSSCKIYVRYLSNALRAEYSKYGITVQCLTPSYVNTNMVAYSELLKTNKLISPDAATFAKSAIRSLGKLDSTTGLWIHDINKLLILLIPTWLRNKIAFNLNSKFRKDYLEAKKEH